MDIWQSGNPQGTIANGWLGRAVVERGDYSGGIPILHIGPGRLPLAVTGAPGGGAVTVSGQDSFHLELGGGQAAQQKARRRLLDELATSTGKAGGNELVSFVQRQHVHTLTAVEQLRELLEGPNAVSRQGSGLGQKLQLIAGLVAKGFGTRIFYVSLEGFDTHSYQGIAHNNLLAE